MADNVSVEREFTIQRLFLKDLSFETPAEPGILKLSGNQKLI